jgi:uncharacterized membrane protein
MLKALWIKWWEKLRASLWLLPSLLTFAALALAEGVLRLDQVLDDRISHDTPLIYPGTAEGARQVLSALAGSLVSLTTISFSIMMVVLTLASNQFGPRVLRNFLSDRLNQTVLGTFVATFVYCAYILGRVPDSDEVGHVPRIAVTLALLLTLTSLGMLITFIHHIARSIQAAQVVRRAHALALHCINHIYPAPLGNEEPEKPAHLPGTDPSTRVESSDCGYVMFIEPGGLIEYTKRHDLVIRLHVKPGDFIIRGACLAEVWGATPPDDLDDDLRSFIVLGSERTPEQDPQCALRQLSEIAIRALSPSTNDPHTAMEAIDYLGSAVACLAGRYIPREARFDNEGQLRAWLPRDDFPGIVEPSLTPLRHYAREHAIVIERLLHFFQVLAPRLERPVDQAWARQQCADIHAQLGSIPDQRSRASLERACVSTSSALGA